MTQAPVGRTAGTPAAGSVGASGLVRVSVASGARRVDLVLPGSVPVAELVPELARSVGLLDAATVYGGYRVVTASGRELSGEGGLVAQGVEDGGLLTLTAGVDEPPPRIYDDVVEAMTDVVERDLQPWSPASGRRTALTAAALLMGLGGVALFVQHDSLLAGVAAGVAAVVLVAGAVVLSRAQREPEAAVTVAWIGAAYGVKIRAHLNFSEVRNVLPRNFQFVLMQIDNLLFLALATIVIFYATDLLTIQWDNGSVVPGTDTIPQWWFYLATPVGWSLLCLRVVQNMIEDVIAIRSGGPLKVQGAMMGE